MSGMGGLGTILSVITCCLNIKNIMLRSPNCSGHGMVIMDVCFLSWAVSSWQVHHPHPNVHLSIAAATSHTSRGSFDFFKDAAGDLQNQFHWRHVGTQILSVCSQAVGSIILPPFSDVALLTFVGWEAVSWHNMRGLRIYHWCGALASPQLGHF